MEQKLEKLLNVTIDENNLDETIKKLNKLFLVVLKKYKEKLYEHNALEIELNSKFAERYSYYKCDYEFKLTNQEIKMFIDNDVETKELRLQIKNVEADINVLEKHLKNIEQTRWDIKNLLDYKKLSSF